MKIGKWGKQKHQPPNPLRRRRVRGARGRTACSCWGAAECSDCCECELEPDDVDELDYEVEPDDDELDDDNELGDEDDEDDDFEFDGRGELMGWAVGFDEQWQRDIGYGVPAVCDHPDCGARIDRGLAHVCGGEPYGGERGCGLYFCAKHLLLCPTQLCARCATEKDPFQAKPDVPEWLEHKRSHPSWAAWRAEQEA